MSDVLQLEKLDLGNTIYIKSKLILLSGDLVTGILLSRIVYWSTADKLGYTKLRVQREGHYWIAKTREEWMRECQITRHEYIRAMARLHQRGLVTSFKREFKGTAVTHVRLIMDRLTEELEKLGGGVVVQCGKRVGSVHKTDRYPSGIWTDNCPLSGHSLIKHRIPTESNLHEEGDVSSTLASEQSGENSVKAGEVDMKAEEILKLRKERSEKVSRSVLAHWQYRMANRTQGMVKPLTVKEAAQLRRLGKSISAMGQDPYAVIDYTLEKWWTYSTIVSNTEALGKGPTEPQIGFFLKYYGYAVNLYLQSIAKPSAQVIQPKQATHVPTKVTAQPKEKPATKEEVAAILEELGY